MKKSKLIKHINSITNLEEYRTFMSFFNYGKELLSNDKNCTMYGCDDIYTDIINNRETAKKFESEVASTPISQLECILSTILNKHISLKNV